MKKTAIWICMVALCVSACASGQDEAPADTPVLSEQQAALVPAVSIIKPEIMIDQTYALYIQDKAYVKAKYEPSQGCYRGAGICYDQTTGGDIGVFEKLTGTDHAIYTNHIKLGDEYPVAWILSCIAQGKTPLLTILPPNRYAPYQEDLLLQTVRDAAMFQIPVFIEFFPYDRNEGYDNGNYVEFYRKASRLFRQYVPTAAMVWGIAGADVYDSFSRYPGDSYVDWIGLRLQEDILPEGDIIYRSALRDMDFAYYSFQKQKPLMLSQISISHYSTSDMGYYTQKAAGELADIYRSIGADYPRIKAVIYESYNELNPAEENRQEWYDNYLITDESLMMTQYKEALADERFLPVVETANDGGGELLMRSPFPAYKADGAYYIGQKSLAYDMAVVGLANLEEYGVTIKGETYYPANILKDTLGFRYKADDEDRRMVIVK